MFKLNIECSKDISELHINFTDNTNAIITKSDKSDESLKDNTICSAKANQPLNDRPKYDNYDNVPKSQDIKLPEIKPQNRPVHVAAELQNLDI